MDRQSWLKWRKEGIGGSDAPVVMGVSPWRTILELYQEKTADSVVDKEPNYAQDRGIRMEPRIRALYEMQMGRTFEPKTVQMGEFPFMRASLDGQDEYSIIEIKLSGKEDWLNSIENAAIPAKYYPQVQHNLLVSGAQECIYLSYLYTKEEPKILIMENLASIVVYPDIEYQKSLLEKCTIFWVDNILRKVPPGLQTGPAKKDEAPLLGFDHAAYEWRMIADQIESLEERKETLRKIILEAAIATGHSKLNCNGIKLNLKSRIGSVDYKKIPELQGVDLEPYRGKSIQYWEMK